MFNKKSRDNLRRSVNEIESKIKAKKKREREDEETWTADEVRQLVEAHTLLGCRFGLFILFQVQNQKGLKQNIKDLLISKLGAEEEDVEDDDKMMKMLLNSDPSDFADDLTNDLLSQFIHDNSVNHAQAILAAHGSKDPEELVIAARSFSEQVDTYYMEHEDEAPLSASIN